MKKQNYIILFMVSLFSLNMYAMMRPMKSQIVCMTKSIDHNILHRSIYSNSTAVKSIAAVSVGVCIGAIICEPVTVLECFATAGFVATPTYLSFKAMQVEQKRSDKIKEFGDVYKKHAIDSLYKLSLEPHDKSAMNDLLRAQWHLLKYKDLKSNDERENLPMHSAPLPLTGLTLVYVASPEILVAGMSASYLLAVAALMQEKKQTNKIDEFIKNQIVFNKENLNPEFIEKHHAMVARVHAQHKQIQEDWDNHTDWDKRQRKEKGEFYYPNIQERINRFSSLIKDEIEDFHA